MEEFSISSFGHPDRNYSATYSAGTNESDPRFGWVTNLLREYDPEMAVKVRRAIKQWNGVIRDQLRNEMGLRLSVGDEAQAIPLRVVEGMPEPFSDFFSSINPTVWGFLLRMRVLENTMAGLQFTLRDYSQLLIIPEGSLPRDLPRGITEAQFFIEHFVAWLKRQEVQGNVKKIHQDILGVYFFRIPEIAVYWMVIGIMSGVLGVPVEALAIVVATHELAHAYSHLGRDIDGSRWETEAFARTDLDIAEGIAQFYTQVVCQRLKDRFPAAEIAYKALLEYQSGPYLVHETWANPKLESNNRNDVSRAGEVIRSSMIEARKTSIKLYPEFESRLRESHRRLNR